ncbi:N-ethylmaleimide reductase [Corynebacterium kalinowskii]|uniref:N-ethylmaleimide reductase n=1 Tax=Corynebacterium kalinowskii TaxID=2675216 RepID=A0A6B8VU62_9CORY|nr:alkene reductase [Corynebacterium kalinowskii]QGU02485.1 N-ethylmaleimide reductase [Corynebacterium kalinowskii]
MTELFAPVQIGAITLPNRMVMAPLTRSRADRDGIPSELHAQYYSQRATAGLIVSEGTFTAGSNRAFPGQPGLENSEQQAGWARVMDAVHAQGGHIFVQLMHAGRLTHAELADGHHPEAPSAIASGTAVRDWNERKECPTPRALEASELPRIVEQFRTAARRAIDAGADGVEIHGANGYLLNEFLSDGANQRMDNYGGSPRNRYRLIEEVLRAVVHEIGAERVGIRFSPGLPTQGITETEVLETYGGLLDAVADLSLAYVSFICAAPAGLTLSDLAVRARANGVTKVLSNVWSPEGTDRALAEQQLAQPYVDAVVVGRALIANPDLVRRWAEDLPLNEPDPATFYAGGARGYTDYPTL